MWSANRVRRVPARIVFGLALIGASATTHGSSCAARIFTLSEAYEAADSIIVGQITECEEEVRREPMANRGANCAFTSLEVLKDSQPVRDYSGIASSSGCGLSLQVGGQYLLFLDSANRPMHFSAPLSGDHYQTKLASRYLTILRGFRAGRVDDLAEPWTYSEHMGQCAVSQSVRGNHISFYVRGPGAPAAPAPMWTRDSIDGQTVYRATVPFYDLDTKLPSGEGEMIAYGEVPDHNSDDVILRVSMQERQPPTMRQATISVGKMTWPLLRMETIVNFSDVSTHTSVEYYATGQSAEQILSTMMSPSDIVVSARIATSSSSESEPEISSPNQPSFGVVSADDSYFGQTAPERSITSESQEANANTKRRYQPKQEPPEPILRIQSRSTQLSRVLKQFEACHAGGQ